MAYLIRDRSVASLTAAQASGTDPVIAENITRLSFVIYPNADGFVSIAPAGSDGMKWAIYAGVARTFEGISCPGNALYVTGQTAGTKLRMGES